MKSVVRITIGCLVVGALFLCGKGVLAYTSPGKPSGFVNDFANVLTADQKSNLENILSDFQKQTTNEISIVTIPTLNDEPIEDYANTLFREWGIGSKTNNNGVLLLAAINDRKLRIEVGYGLEGALPDLLTKQIQENEIISSFKDGNYANGLQRGVTAVMQATRGEYQNNNPQQEDKSFPTELIFLGLFFGAQIIFAILAPTKSWWLGGVIGGIGGGVLGFILSSFVFGIVAGLFGVVIGLLVDYFVSKNYKGPGDHSGGPWFFGGGGSSFGGGGFGGFGGGSSGGGGSSSNW